MMTLDDSNYIDPINNEPDADSFYEESEDLDISYPPEEELPPIKPTPFSIFGSIQTIITYAILLATLFTLFTPSNLFSGDMMTRMFEAWHANPTMIAPVNTAVVNFQYNRIGIVSGHWKNDSGALCDNGLTEAEVNLAIASAVQKQLTTEGFQVDLLEEFDARLANYKGIALISIHADTCDYVSDTATGFKVAAAMFSMHPEKATRLTSCMTDRYARRTGLPYNGSITNDMTYYHAFDEIDSETTAAIIETGFLNLDQQILTQKPDLIAQGIVDGLLCFIRNENIMPTPTPDLSTTLTPTP